MFISGMSFPPDAIDWRQKKWDGHVRIQQQGVQVEVTPSPREIIGRVSQSLSWSVDNSDTGPGPVSLLAWCPGWRVAVSCISISPTSSSRRVFTTPLVYLTLWTAMRKWENRTDMRLIRGNLLSLEVNDRAHNVGSSGKSESSKIRGWIILANVDSRKVGLSGRPLSDKASITIISHLRPYYGVRWYWIST